MMKNKKLAALLGVLQRQPIFRDLGLGFCNVIQ